jgi:signal transduction histidine kinase
MNDQLTTRLILPLALLGGLLLLIAGGSAWYVRDMQQRVAGPIGTSVASVRAAQELEISAREVRTHISRYLITGERKYLATVPQLQQRTAEALARAEQAAGTPEEDTLMRQVRRGYENFFTQYEKIQKNPPARGMYLSIMELIDDVLDREILDPAHAYLRLNEGMLARASEENQAAADRLTVGLLGLGLCGAVGGVLGGWALAAALRRSFQRTEERLRDAADRLDRAVLRDAEPLPEPPPADALERVHVSVSAVLRRLRRTERDALRAEQLAWVGQMAAGIAHEIRNPLMAMKLLVQAAADRPGGPRLSPRDFRVLEEEITRLELIVSGFLDFARPPRPDQRPVPARPLLEQVLDGVRTRAELQGVRLELDPPGDGVVLHADANQLRQVLYNLLFNALDAQPRGGRVRVGVEIESAPGEEPAAVLRVEDDGPGLPPALGENIFEPFVSTKESGLGLGLSICRRIAESHGGSVRAANRPDGGAVFAVRLPVARVADTPEPRPLAPARPAAAPLTNGERV